MVSIDLFPSFLSESDDHNNSDEVVVSTKCKNCEICFTQATILKHISHSKSCRKSYKNEEIQLYKEWAKERIAETKNLLYNPEKQRKLYLEKKRKAHEHKNIQVIL